MKFKILIYFFLFAFFSCKSNYTKIGEKNADYVPYYLKVYEADSLYLVGNYAKNYEILDSLFKNFEPINMTLYFEFENYIKSSLLLKNKKGYTKEVERLIKDLGYNYEDIKNDSLLNQALLKTNISEEKVGKLHKKYFSKIDTVFRNKLNEINIEDQLVRNNGSTNEEIMQTLKKHDSIIKNYMEIIGYPGEKKVGTYRMLFDKEEPKKIGMAVILNHLSNTEAYEFYKLKLPDYIKDGTCPPKDYAQMIDRHYLHKSNTTYYYFIPTSYSLNQKENELAKIINLRRKLFGLPSLEYENLWYQKRILNY